MLKKNLIFIKVIYHLNGFFYIFSCVIFIKFNIPTDPLGILPLDLDLVELSSLSGRDKESKNFGETQRYSKWLEEFLLALK